MLINSKVRIARGVFIAGCSDSRAEVSGGSVSDGVVKTTSWSSYAVRNVSTSKVPAVQEIHQVQDSAICKN